MLEHMLLTLSMILIIQQISQLICTQIWVNVNHIFIPFVSMLFVN